MTTRGVSAAAEAGVGTAMSAYTTPETRSQPFPEDRRRLIGLSLFEQGRSQNGEIGTTSNQKPYNDLQKKQESGIQEVTRHGDKIQRRAISARPGGNRR